MPKKIFVLLVSLSISSCSIFSPIPQPKREFRGFWVATVANIDWPKNGKDAIEKQKTDFLEILEFYKDLNFNAAIVQIRTAGDAFYESQYAPWSRFLTGQEGKALSEKGDILEWMIAESHKRGMEFHAWLNPYRATFDLNTEILSPKNDYFLHPEWMIKYGKKYYYDPGLPQVQERLVSIMDELINHYEIDAIHFDDYFYPYKIKGESFDDSLSYSYHHRKGQSLEDWRRSNVDSLIKKVFKTIKTKKPWVQFGVSPFGVWKNKSTDPNGSDTKAGQTTYEDLYADPLLWMQKGWLDYIVPQVYWSMDLSVAPHKKIVEWWATQNTTTTNLYIGNGAYKVRNNSDTAWDKKKELPDQLKLARKNDAVLGNVFFSAKSLKNNNPDVVSHLKKKFYAYKALPPVSKAISAPMESSEPIKLVLNKNDRIGFETNGKGLGYLLVYTSGKRLKPEYPIQKLLDKLPVKDLDLLVIDKKRLIGHKHVACTFLDEFGRESKPILVNLKHPNLNDTKK